MHTEKKNKIKWMNELTLSLVLDVNCRNNNNGFRHIMKYEKAKNNERDSS